MLYYLKLIANGLWKVYINVISINLSFKACGNTSLLVLKKYLCSWYFFFPDDKGHLLNTQNLVT